MAAAGRRIAGTLGRKSQVRRRRQRDAGDAGQDHHDARRHQGRKERRGKSRAVEEGRPAVRRAAQEGRCHATPVQRRARPAGQGVSPEARRGHQEGAGRDRPRPASARRPRSTGGDQRRDRSKSPEEKISRRARGASLMSNRGRRTGMLLLALAITGCGDNYGKIVNAEITLINEYTDLLMKVVDEDTARDFVDGYLERLKNRAEALDKREELYLKAHLDDQP